MEQRDLIEEFIGVLFSALQSSMKIIIQVINKQKQQQQQQHTNPSSISNIVMLC